MSIGFCSPPFRSQELLVGADDASPESDVVDDGGGVCCGDYIAEHGLNSVVEQAIDSTIRANVKDPKAHMAAFFLRVHAERSRDACTRA